MKVDIKRQVVNSYSRQIYICTFTCNISRVLSLKNEQAAVGILNKGYEILMLLDIKNQNIILHLCTCIPMKKK